MLPESIQYIGVNDTDLDLFEGQYPIPNGISYNSYVILDEKIAVMDTVDGRKTAEFLANLERVLDGRSPDYLVIHHVEPDHAASISALVERYPQVQLVTSAKALQMLPLYHPGLDLSTAITIQNGDTLELGEHALTFLAAPMVHWPEVMVSYERATGILFSADAFGKFGTPDTPEDWDGEARRYYFNIVGKFGPAVQTLLKKAEGLNIRAIYPLHGPILEADLEHYLALYRQWAGYEPECPGVCIACASLHGNTLQAAQQLKEMLLEQGCPAVELVDLRRTDLSEALAQAFRFGTMVLCASSYNGGVAPAMEDLIHHLAAKNFQKRTVALVENGSWAPSAARTMGNLLGTLKDITLVEGTVTLKGAVKESDLEALSLLATKLAQSSH
jgi:flavorubredoxin